MGLRTGPDADLISMAFIQGTIVAVGDSLTDGSGGVTSWPTRMATDLGLTAINHGHGAEGWAFNASGGTSNPTLTSRAPSEVDTNVGTSPQPFLILWAGTNDMVWGSTPAQAYASFAIYMDARLAAGWARRNIVVLTCLPRDPGQVEADRVSYNSLLVSGQAIYGYSLVRLDLDSRIGLADCNLDTTYYNADQTHLKNTGQQVVADLVEATRDLKVARFMRFRA
jgi:hypothetical protein